MNKNSLANTYSLSTGLKINKPHINLLPFPLPFDKFLVFHNSSGNESKNYDYFQVVIDFIKPILDKNNIHIVQLGGAEDKPLGQVLNLQGKTSIAQTNYILNNSLLLIANDSMLGHIAGALNKNVVILYGPTSATAHGPFWRGNDTILIESHRNGNLPSYSFNENPKTINLIKPEEVYDAILSILKLESEFKYETINIGSNYGYGIIETVLDSVVGPDFIKEASIIIRYDYLENPQNLANQLSIRKCVIVTDKPIDLNLLKHFKPNILQLQYKITENHNSDFAKSVKRIGIPIKLFSEINNEELNRFKMEYFDIGLIHTNKVSRKEDIENYEKINSNTLFKTNKIILSNKKIYSSNTHRLLNIPQEEIVATENKVIDVPQFYEERDFFYFFNKTS